MYFVLPDDFDYIRPSDIFIIATVKLKNGSNDHRFSIFRFLSGPLYPIPSGSIAMPVDLYTMATFVV